MSRTCARPIRVPVVGVTPRQSQTPYNASFPPTLGPACVCVYVADDADAAGERRCLAQSLFLSLQPITVENCTTSLAEYAFPGDQGR